MRLASRRQKQQELMTEPGREGQLVGPRIDEGCGEQPVAKPESEVQRKMGRVNPLSTSWHNIQNEERVTCLERFQLTYEI